jgi:hypothetical protein
MKDLIIYYVFLTFAYKGAIFDKVNNSNKKWTTIFQMINDGINRWPTLNQNHKQMSNNGYLDWTTMARYIE